MKSEIEPNLRAHVETLCRSERNTSVCPEGLKDSENWIADRFTGLGYRVVRVEYLADGMVCANVEATCPSFVGTDQPHLIVGAHYDSAPGTPGADDNASAVAILLELARMLAGDPAADRLRYVAFPNEEPPHFVQDTMGSVVHAKACRRRGDAIAGMVCLESLGVFTNDPGTQELPIDLEQQPAEKQAHFRERHIDPAVGNFLAMVADEQSAAFMASFDAHWEHDRTLPVVAVEMPDLRLSDHLAYWDEGYPAIMLTDTAPFRNRHYHRRTDTPEKLNYPVMALLTARLANALRGMARELTPQLSPGRRSPREASIRSLGASPPAPGSAIPLQRAPDAPQKTSCPPRRPVV